MAAEIAGFRQGWQGSAVTPWRTLHACACARRRRAVRWHGSCEIRQPSGPVPRSGTKIARTGGRVRAGQPDADNRIQECRMSRIHLFAEPAALDIELDRSALVIIDMQRDFLEPGGFGEALGNDVSKLQAAVGPCKEVLGKARESGHARHPHPRRPPARPHRCAPAQGRARRPRDADRRARPDGPHPGARRARPRHHPRALSGRRTSR